MKVLFERLAIAVFVLAVAPFEAGAQDVATQTRTEQRNPDFCGAGGAGCDPADVQQWKAVGNRLADLSSADLSQYAYACVQHPDWKKDCETDPTAILKRLGIEGY
jgi:hypothetical protein